MMRRGCRRWIGILVVGVALLAACSITETMHGPMCDGSRTSGLIAAQSVPTASRLPCFESVPPGWEMATVLIDEQGTEVALDSDRAGEESAILRFAESCDVSGAASTPYSDEGVKRYDHIRQVSPSFHGDRFYVFEGGCVWWEFRFGSDAPSALSSELDNGLLLIERHIINDNMRESFIDEDL